MARFGHPTSASSRFDNRSLLRDHRLESSPLTGVVPVVGVPPPPRSRPDPSGFRPSHRLSKASPSIIVLRSRRRSAQPSSASNTKVDITTFTLLYPIFPNKASTSTTLTQLLYVDLYSCCPHFIHD
ncbi:hypothetical protein M6B38_398025 [Iris pallida]|uniref:Uncharacterized protein n=1 Tax=Iris pallida TaxID=29817 RepID=A0AAX6FUU8_IRIPA|nr:hypothetical protein M6B38_398025 [Iris pallida]